MIHSYFSSEDFRPKRLVYAFREQRILEHDKAYKGEKAKHDAKERAKRDDAKERARKAVSPKQIARYIESSQKKQHVIQDDISKKLHARLDKSDAKTAVMGFAKGLGDYNTKGGWKKWNEAFAANSKKLGFEGEVGPDQIKAMQRVVFTELGLTGDPSAFVDGKIGPYTRAAMAIYAGKGSEVKIPMTKKNFRLARARVGRKAEGGEILRGGKWQKDGSYEVETGEDKIQFKNIDGQWKWRQGEGEWFDVSQSQGATEGPYAVVSKIAKKLSMLGKDPEQEKIRLTYEKAGTLDSNYEWSLVRSDTSETGYELKKWKPIDASIGMGHVEKYNPGTYYMEVGNEKIFNIDGEKVKVKLVKYDGNIKKYSIEGVEGTFEVHTMYNKAIERAKAMRAAKKPGAKPPVSETLHPVTHSNPYGKPPLGVMEGWYTPQQVYNYYTSIPGTEGYDLFGPQLPVGWSENWVKNNLRKAPQPVVQAEPEPLNPTNAKNLAFLDWDPSKPSPANGAALAQQAYYPNSYMTVFPDDPTAQITGALLTDLMYGQSQTPAYQLTAASEAPPAAADPPKTHDELHSWAWANLKGAEDQRPPAPSWMTTEEQLRGYYCNPPALGTA